jgi:hypothetical protein
VKSERTVLRGISVHARAWRAILLTLVLVVLVIDSMLTKVRKFSTVHVNILKKSRYCPVQR